MEGVEALVSINPVTTILMTWVVIAIILILAWFFSRNLRERPGRRQAAVEILIGWFDRFLRESFGEDSRKFLPLITTLFLFILVSNLMNAIPGLRAPTRDLNTCLGLGILVFAVCHGSAIKKKGIKGYLAAYFKPHWILFPSNVFSEFSKTISHSVRLFGNIFAGGIVISIVPMILVQIFQIFNKRFGIPIWLSIPFGITGMPILNVFFGLFIGGVQAFIFSILAVAYISVLRE